MSIRAAKSAIGIGLVLAACMPLHSAAQTSRESNAPVPNSYIVTFRPTIGAQQSPIAPGRRANPAQGVPPVPFSQHSSGQDKVVLARSLGIRGSVKYIFDRSNAAYLEIESDEAERLQRDPRVLRVEQARHLKAHQSTQLNPGWALDRLDQPTTVLDNRHVYTTTGAGQTIYVLDSGLNMGNAGVQAEFGARASVVWDFNELDGADCTGHGTNMASAAAGATYGLAKGATIRAAKITKACGYDADSGVAAMAFNWLADNAPAGTIALLSYGASAGFGCPNQLNDPSHTILHLDDAIARAHDAGIIVVVSAGNDGCDTAFFTPARNSKAFVVGATNSSRLTLNQDAKWADSRTGANISTFAPGQGVPVLSAFGTPDLAYGTSVSAAYIAGLFAVGCPVPTAIPAGSFCSTTPMANVYALMRSIAVTGTVVMPDGALLPANTMSRFNNRAPW